MSGARKALVAMTSLLIPFLPASAGAAPVPVKAMLIGDSLSVGGFGRAMQESLRRRFGKDGVCVFASCGSSPEDWTKGGFVTRCGYRQTTPSQEMLYEYQNGKRPRPVKTPKLRDIMARYRPGIVIVQLGTNWMDKLAEPSHPSEAHYRGVIRDFIREVSRHGSAAVFWVLPPASAAYPQSVHAEVEQWINEESRKLGFYTVNSRTLTAPYRRGVTGGDGVHYSDSAGEAWARGVSGKIFQALQSLNLAPGPASG